MSPFGVYGMHSMISSVYESTNKEEKKSEIMFIYVTPQSFYQKVKKWTFVQRTWGETWDRKGKTRNKFPLFFNQQTMKFIPELKFLISIYRLSHLFQTLVILSLRKITHKNNKSDERQRMTRGETTQTVAHTMRDCCSSKRNNECGQLWMQQPTWVPSKMSLIGKFFGLSYPAWHDMEKEKHQ